MRHGRRKGGLKCRPKLLSQASTFQRPAWRLHTLLADGKTALFQQCVARLNEEELDELMGQPERGETPLTALFREKDACLEDIRLMFTLYPRYATLRDSAGMNMLHSYILRVPGFVDERVVRLLVELGVDVTAKIAQPSNSRATAQEREREELSISLSLLSCPGYKNGDSASEALLRRGSVSQIFGGWGVACLRTNDLERLLGVLRELGAPLDHYTRARDIITNISDADDALKRRLYALHPTPQEVQQRECAAEHGVAAAELTRFTLIVMPNGAVPAPCVGPSKFVYHCSDYDSDYSKKTGEAFRTHISAHDLTSLKEQLLKSLRSYCSHHESYSGTGFAPTTAATLQLMGAEKADSLVIADLKALKQAAAGNWQNGIRIFASASDSDDGVQIERRASTPPKTAIAVPLVRLLHTCPSVPQICTQCARMRRSSLARAVRRARVATSHA